jgi:hypothetical protein
MLPKLKWKNPGEPLATRYNWCQGPVPGRGPAVEKHCSKPILLQIFIASSNRLKCANKSNFRSYLGADNGVYERYRLIQGVPLATEPVISLIILPLMRISQRNLKRIYLIVKEKNVHLFKFRCNIFIGVRIIKEMPGSVTSGTLCRSDVVYSCRVYCPFRGNCCFNIYSSGWRERQYLRPNFAFKNTRHQIPRKDNIQL